MVQGLKSGWNRCETGEEEDRVAGSVFGIDHLGLISHLIDEGFGDALTLAAGNGARPWSKPRGSD